MNVKLLLFSFFTFLVSMLVNAQAVTEYVIEYDLNLDDVIHFNENFSLDGSGNSIGHGIDIPNLPSGNSVSIEMKNKDFYNFYSNSATIPGNLIIYKSTVSASTTGYGGTGDETSYVLPDWFNQYREISGRRSNDNKFYRGTAKSLHKVADNGWFTNTPMKVIVKLTLTGNDVSLTDIRRVRIPGLNGSNPVDASFFVNKTGYNANHACGSTGNGTNICNTYNGIRSIPNLNTTDMKIQAHRGIWGKANQENTIGAMAQAVSDNYPLLESDIMPYGVTNSTNPSATNFAVPAGLAAFHDFTLTRYSNGTDFILNRDYLYLRGLRLNEVRSDNLGNERILFYNSNGNGESLPVEQSGLLGFAATRSDRGLLIDMKNIESKGQGASCQYFCEFQTQARKNISLFHNLALAINKAAAGNNLRYITFKTYLTFEELRTGLLNVGVSEANFRKVLWAPILADSDNSMDPAVVKKYLDDWFAHNEAVLYYETNFFNDGAPLLANDYCIEDVGCYNVMEYIYRMSGRRAGIFSEEPVGGKGTVNRWGSWKLKNPGADRRGDHLWLLKQPFFKHAVITTDRPDIWDQLND